MIVHENLGNKYSKISEIRKTGRTQFDFTEGLSSLRSDLGALILESLDERIDRPKIAGFFEGPSSIRSNHWVLTHQI